MNYKTESITQRAEESPLWPEASRQQGEVLPYLLERYLLLENWKYRDRLMSGQEPGHTSIDDIQYLHLLLAEATTVLLSQEERIRRLEAWHLSDQPYSRVDPLIGEPDKFEKLRVVCVLCGKTYGDHEHFSDACPVDAYHDTQKFKAT